MAIVRNGPTKCAHEPGCPHDIGPSSAGFAPAVNSLAVPELRTGAGPRGSGPVERVPAPMTTDGRGDHPAVLHHRGYRAREGEMTETTAAWPTGTTDADKARRSELLHAAMDRNAHTLDPVARACEDLGIKRNAASMILRAERLRDGLSVPLGAVAELTAYADGSTSARVVHDAGSPGAEAFHAEFGDPGRPVDLEPVGAAEAAAALAPWRSSPTGRSSDPDLVAYRVVREFIDRMGPMAPSIDLRDELARRIADRAADAA